MVDTAEAGMRRALAVLAGEQASGEQQAKRWRRIVLAALEPILTDMDVDDPEAATLIRAYIVISKAERHHAVASTARGGQPRGTTPAGRPPTGPSGVSSPTRTGGTP